MDTPQPAAKASTKKEKIERERNEPRDERVGEEVKERHTRNILGSLGAAWCSLDLPITPVAPAVAHWTPRPKKRTDVEGCRADSPRQRYLA